MGVDTLVRKRALAALIDAAIVVLLYVITYYSLESMHVAYTAILAYANCYLMTIVFPVFVWTGQSVGKKLMGLKIVVAGAKPESRVMLFVRELCKSILFTGINALTLTIFLAFPLLNTKHLALHDILAKTSVMQVSEAETIAH